MPVGLPEGAGTRDGTYLYVFVCWWEVPALKQLLGDDKARQIVDVMIERGVYRWVYRTIRDEEEHSGRLFLAAGLPSPAAPKSSPGRRLEPQGIRRESKATARMRP